MTKYYRVGDDFFATFATYEEAAAEVERRKDFAQFADENALALPVEDDGCDDTDEYKITEHEYDDEKYYLKKRGDSYYILEK